MEGTPLGDHSYDKSDLDSILNTSGYWVYSSNVFPWRFDGVETTTSLPVDGTLR